MWLDYFENIASNHRWPEHRKALEAHTLFENVVATWLIKQEDYVKEVWLSSKHELIQNFAHNNVIETAPQQFEPVAQFAVKIKQVFLRADPKMSKKMKLFLLWPRLRHDLSWRVCDQSPTTLQRAIQITQRVESPTHQPASILVHIHIPTSSR